MEYGSRNVLADPEIREGVKRFTAWPTIPQASDTVCAVYKRIERCELDQGFSSPRASQPQKVSCGVVDPRPPQVFIKGEFVGGR